MHYYFTEADKKGIKSSTDRCLKRHLVLVTPHKLGNDEKTLLPQGLWKDGETLRQVRIAFLINTHSELTWITMYDCWQRIILIGL